MLNDFNMFFSTFDFHRFDQNQRKYNKARRCNTIAFQLYYINIYFIEVIFIEMLGYKFNSVNHQKLSVYYSSQRFVISQYNRHLILPCFEFGFLCKNFLPL